jgi:3-hydroxy-9,10-secoandrosta-1,3,5(10)-triene-9,17-dione monooxygenase reductase component
VKGAGQAGGGVTALRELPIPVVIIAAADGAATACATGTTMYVSLSPPIITVALRPGSRTARMVVRTGRFSLSVLAAGQADLARRAGRAGSAPDKMAEAGLAPEPSPEGDGPPGVAGAAAVLWCAVRDVVTSGDHLVIFGDVRSCRGASAGTAVLLRHHRRYLASGAPASEYAPEGYPV